MRKTGDQRLTPDRWVRAALAAIARGGVDAVAVETIATELGATKGSFYWHFKNRDALIHAALDEWEQRWTDAIIEDLGLEPDPAQRLRTIFQTAFELAPADRVEIALLATPNHPAALRAVRRVAERRIRYMSEQLEKLGWSEAESLDRAVLIYYTYVGQMQMAHVLPRIASGDARRRHFELVFTAFATGDLPAESAMRDGASVPSRLPSGRSPTHRRG